MFDCAPILCLTALLFSPHPFHQNWNFHLARWKISLISYFCWLTLCLLFLGIYYYEQELFRQADAGNNWQEEIVAELENVGKNQATEENILVEENVHPGVDMTYGCTKLEVNEPSTKAADRRAVFNKDSMESYIYETGERRHVDAVCFIILIMC
jgi:hypothetical protein